MLRSDFEKLVKVALDELPDEFAKKLENIEIVIEEELSPPLYGLYRGVPKTKRGSGYTFVLPDKITIFQKTIEAVSRTPEEIKKRVKGTVLHEIGHHFGLSDVDLDKTKVG
ncbi:metallopeptidase family protein [Candidatus Gottesmanbacteria bacterium]|nr:metallopeptidase family protein [Candidatus Gottesmanbacteria bacterium]